MEKFVVYVVIDLLGFDLWDSWNEGLKYFCVILYDRRK